MHLPTSPNKLTDTTTNCSLQLAHITDGASPFSNNLHHDYLISIPIKELKLRSYNMDCWSFLSNCISYAIPSLPQYCRMILTTPENKYDHKMYKLLYPPQSVLLFNTFSIPITLTLHGLCFEMLKLVSEVHGHANLVFGIKSV